MKITITSEAKDYLRKKKLSSMLIDMIPQETSAGWGCGTTKRYYIPSVRIGYNTNSSKYLKFNIDELEVLLSPKVEQENEEGITIYLEKVFFVKKLDVKGISMSMV